MADDTTGADVIPPGHYIEKVNRATGEPLADPIEPRDLLVAAHRDFHVVDVQARTIMSQLVDLTGNEEFVRQAMKEVRKLGHVAGDLIGKVIGERASDRAKQALFGLKDREYFFRYKKAPHTEEEIQQTVARLQKEAAERLEAITKDGKPQLRVLLTGGTGFVGKEIIWQAAHDDAVTEMFVLIRPKQIRDRKTKQVVKTLSPADRGAALLEQLWLADHPAKGKFTFIAGDIEQPGLGISDEDLAAIEKKITHVIHCAASVAFDDPYDASFRANVCGSLNALAFSKRLQDLDGSAFVCHLAIETSYIHGRQTSRDVAREDEIVFPKNFYNNYYELTKAMASIETERFMLDEGLRITQLCPAIVIGDRVGNNRGDTKVVNAPVNVFGRAHQALTDTASPWTERTAHAVIAKMACIFPGDPSAELNLIPVDWVVAGIMGALKTPKAVGLRTHLATDNRVTAQQIRDTVGEELEVKVRLAEPTLHRNVTLPVLSRLLGAFGQEKLAGALEKLGTIFGGYSEWGQPIHQVGNDVKILGLSEPRPNTPHAFRMLCRHNRYVQHFGQIRDDDEISRREKVWRDFVLGLEKRTGRAAGELTAQEFRTALELEVDVESMTPRGKLD